MNGECEKFFNQIAKKQTKYLKPERVCQSGNKVILLMIPESSTRIFISRRKQQKSVWLCLQMNE